jgi:biopolymer transport protein ExbB
MFCAFLTTTLLATGAPVTGEQDLQKALADLSALRESIAAEKLPLTRELAASESRLAELRREYDDALRAIDTSGLELGKTEGASKLRREEIDYVRSLLDEFTRNFETKLAVGEAQRYGEPIKVAKEALENKELDDAAKFDRQFDVVHRSIERAKEAFGGSRFPGSAVDPNGVLAAGNFALVGPIAMFATSDGKTAGLALTQTGSPHPAVRPLAAALSPGLLAVVRDGTGLLPLDPTRGSALEELVKRGSIVHIFRKGGPIMWPLLVVSILALGAVLERTAFIIGEFRKRDARSRQALFAAVEAGDVDRAIGIGETSKDFVTRTMAYALGHRETSLPSALLYARAQEIKRFSRGLAILDTSITIAPLLGLLGTVTGMMASFSLIGGELSAPTAITGGIAEALIATAFGLGIAIVALVPYNYLNKQIELATGELEANSTQLELLVHQAVLEGKVAPTGPTVIPMPGVAAPEPAR